MTDFHSTIKWVKDTLFHYLVCCEELQSDHSLNLMSLKELNFYLKWYFKALNDSSHYDKPISADSQTLLVGPVNTFHHGAVHIKC